MYEVPVIAWLVAAAFAAVVLAFCTYEVVWKARRLQRDLVRLQTLSERVNRLQDDLATIALRADALTGPPPPGAD